MKRLFLVLLAIGLLLAVGMASGGATESVYGKYLTAADVEKITGLKGITRKEASLTLTFFLKENQKILEARFDAARLYKKEIEKNQPLYTLVSGIGEKAALAVPSMPYRLLVLKGKYCVMVQTVAISGQTPVSKEQLLALAKLITEKI